MTNKQPHAQKTTLAESIIAGSIAVIVIGVLVLSALGVLGSSGDNMPVMNEYDRHVENFTDNLKNLNFVLEVYNAGVDSEEERINVINNYTEKYIETIDTFDKFSEFLVKFSKELKGMDVASEKTKMQDVIIKSRNEIIIMKSDLNGMETDSTSTIETLNSILA